MVKKFKKLKKILIIIILIALITCFTATLLITSAGAEIHKIELNEDGFSPENLNIKKGDTVIFYNATKYDFWPASDIHPLHTVFSEFDPKKPIEPGKSWSFKFNKVGTWPFHDHLRANFTGTIYVTDKLGKKIDNCLDKSKESYKICIEKQIEETVLNEGLDKGFKLIENLYGESQVFASECHDYAHTIGEAAYELYASVPEKFKVTENTSICGFGFYHGFMEQLILMEGSPKEANKFCDLIEKNLNTFSGASCFHGIGHGTATPHSQNLYGNEKAMIEPSLKLCAESTDTNARLTECKIGTYAAIASFRANNEFNLEIPTKPLDICKAEPEENKEACYGGFVPNLVREPRREYAIAAKIIESEIEDEKHAGRAISMLAGPVVYSDLKNRDYSSFIEICRTLRSNLRAPCIQGFVTAYIETSASESAEAIVKRFCNASFFTHEEKNICLSHANNVLQQFGRN